MTALRELIPIGDGQFDERLTLDYQARKPFVDFHERKERWAVIVAHRRAGKTVACVMELIKACSGNKRDRPPPQYAYIAPLYKQAKAVAWDYLKYYGQQIPGAVCSETELRVTFPGSGNIRLYGADNPDALRGIHLDGLILDEAADMSPAINAVIRPTLVDHKGWCVWIGTPKGQNDFYDLVHGVKGGFIGAKDHPDWFYRMLKASETKLVDQDELDSLKSQMTPEEYQQEFECSFSAAILGAYYGREMEAAESAGRITKNIYDPTLQVHTAWDLGQSNATAIWFYQQQNFEIRIIDFYTASKEDDLQHYVAVLKDRAVSPSHPTGYNYGKHYLPHDVKTKLIGMPKTRLQQLREAGLIIEDVPKHSIDDGISEVRRILPRCYFDREKCADGIKALRQYHREWDDVRKTFVQKPYHDWASDPADAFRYLAMGLKNPASNKAVQAMPQRDRRWIY